jgi:hypothetical protein
MEIEEAKKSKKAAEETIKRILIALENEVGFRTTAVELYRGGEIVGINIKVDL